MRWMILLLSLSLLACSGPRDAPLPKDLDKMESIKPVLEKLKPDERDLVTGYIMRHTLGAKFGSMFGVKIEPIPDGMTIGKAIDEQRAFIEKNKADEAAKKAEQEKAEAARKVLADQMAQILSAQLSKVDLHKASYRDFDVKDYVKFTIEFDNRGSKDITGLKGIANFKDKFGDTISNLPIKIEQKISAGKKVTVVLSKDFNQFVDEDRRLASIDASSVQFSISPDVILFADGTKFEAPQTK